MNPQQIPQPVIISNSPEYGVPQIQNILYINNINNQQERNNRVYMSLLSSNDENKY